MIKRQALGQHFLTSNHVAQLIAEYAAIKSDDVVLEVGTGRGILTPYLCRVAKKVVSVEKDYALYKKAKEKFCGIKNLRLEYGDAFEVDCAVFTVFVSNLPYSESRSALEWLVQKKFSHAIIMLQKEFAQKLLLKEGKERRSVSVLAGYCMEMEKLMDVKKTEFHPSPKVDSVVMRLRCKHVLSKDILAAVNALFSYKRKTIRAIAKNFNLVIDSDERLEDLSDKEIIKIARKIVR